MNIKPEVNQTVDIREHLTPWHSYCLGKLGTILQLAEEDDPLIIQCNDCGNTGVMPDVNATLLPPSKKKRLPLPPRHNSYR